MTQAETPAVAPRVTAVTFSRVAIIATASYAGAQMLADIASLKIGLVAGFAVDMGTFIYPITFTLRDVVHKVLGKRNAQTLIVMAAVINLVMALYLGWVARVPSDPTWGLGESFSAILGPVWRIVIASILAEIVSELIDTEIYHWFVTKVTTRYQWARVLASNSVSIPIDNLIFAVIAFGGIVPLSALFTIIWSGYLFKVLFEILATPITYKVVNWLKKEEGVDTYDVEIDYNQFKVN